MLKLIERSVETVDTRLILLAPPLASVPHAFRNVHVAPEQHQGLVRQMQRMRGGVYLEDGAVQRHQLSAEGLHQTPEDERSWHMLLMNGSHEITACAWFLQHDVEASFEDLRVGNSPLALAEGWRPKLWYAVEYELAQARSEGLSFAEFGGWAVAKASRCTSEPLLLALATYSLGRRLGAVLGMTTATVRHSSAAILRRLGGSLLRAAGEEIPPYYDPKYGCMMEILGFDSRKPNPRYASLIELLGQKILQVPIVTPLGVPAPVELDSLYLSRPQYLA